MKDIKIKMQWRGKELSVPQDIEPHIDFVGSSDSRFYISARSPLGEEFANDSSVSEKLDLIYEILLELQYQEERTIEIEAQDDDSIEPF